MSEEFRKKVGDRFKIARKYLKLTQQELGEVLGCSQSKIKDIEKGRLMIVPETAVILSKEYDVSLDWLYSGTGEMFGSFHGLSDKDKDYINSLINRLK